MYVKSVQKAGSESTLFSVTWMKITMLCVHFPSLNPDNPSLYWSHTVGKPRVTLNGQQFVTGVPCLLPRYRVPTPTAGAQCPFSLLPLLPPSKKCCFWKEADLSSLSLFFFLIVDWQHFSATGDSSGITKYIRELFGKCGYIPESQSSCFFWDTRQIWR